MREFSVGLTARVAVSPGKDADEAWEKACELMDVLDADPRAMGPSTWCAHEPPTAHARFNVYAETAAEALELATMVMADALEKIGLGSDMDLFEVEIEEEQEEPEEHEEAAALEPAGDQA